MPLDAQHIGDNECAAGVAVEGKDDQYRINIWPCMIAEYHADKWRKSENCTNKTCPIHGCNILKKIFHFFKIFNNSVAK